MYILKSYSIIQQYSYGYTITTLKLLLFIMK